MRQTSEDVGPSPSLGLFQVVDKAHYLVLILVEHYA